MFTTNKTHSVAIRVLATVGTLLLLPITVMGILARLSSNQHQQYINEEKQFVVNSLELTTQIETQIAVSQNLSSKNEAVTDKNI